MNHLRFLRIASAAALLLVTAVCSSATDNDNDPQDSGDPHFLRLSESAPAPALTTVGFWAVQGQDRRAEINFAAAPGALDTAEFLKFRVRPTSLASRPDGSPIALGDSIFITITVEDAEKMIFRFEPSGLRFSSAEPARLDLYYGQADHDFDDDGSIDDDDLSIESKLAIWKQEVLLGPWIRMGGIRDVTIDEIEVNITSFTGYAIAY